VIFLLESNVFLGFEEDYITYLNLKEEESGRKSGELPKV
jgi:hypothetical protein